MLQTGLCKKLLENNINRSNLIKRLSSSTGMAIAIYPLSPRLEGERSESAKRK